MKIHHGIAGVCLAVMSATSVQAATLYSVAPVLTGDQAADCVYNTTCGPQYTGNTYAAQQFTLTSGSSITGLGFNAIVLGDFGTAANYRILASTAGSTPGALIAQGTAALSNAAGPAGTRYQTTNYTFGISMLQLAAGNYFFAFQNESTNRDDYLSLGAALSGAFQSNDGGLTFSQSYQGYGSVAISVFGDAVVAPVPEPATWAMMLLGFGMMGFGLRRRSNVKTTVSYA